MSLVNFDKMEMPTFKSQDCQIMARVDNQFDTFDSSFNLNFPISFNKIIAQINPVILSSSNNNKILFILNGIKRNNSIPNFPLPNNSFIFFFNNINSKLTAKNNQILSYIFLHIFRTTNSRYRKYSPNSKSCKLRS